MAKGKRKRAAREKNAGETAATTPSPEPRRSWRERPRWQWILALLLLLTLCSSAAAWLDWYVTLPADRVATHVGSDSCIACHQGQHRAWHGSHHDLAMDLATPETVLGNFDDVELEHYGVTSRMYRDGDRYMIHTEGPDGEPADFEVKYVFGFKPLQNYMVEIERAADAEPGEIGRVQVLRETWDAEKGEWYYLMPTDVDEHLTAGDQLHWCGQAQNWNRACASCHSTNLQKNHRMVATGTGGYHSVYHTTYSEIDVSCEACHGPGSIHVELAEARSLFWDRKRGYGIRSLHNLPAQAEVDNCGQCHSRRRQLTTDFRPGEDYNDHYLYTLLAPGLYWCDGQIRDEVYVYGSFLQSRMYAEGIRCGDCHNPHTTELRHEGNALCTSCHQHPAEKYDVPAHHHHRTGTEGASCVECHMPATTYMALDARRDHSLRVPRPDLSVDMGTPNACSRCHLQDESTYAVRQAELPEYQHWLEAAHAADRSAADTLARVDAWCLEHYTEWYGEPEDRETHFAHALHQAWELEPQGFEPLLAVIGDSEQPPIIRASAVQALSGYLSQNIDFRQPRFAQASQTLLETLDDPSPRLRAAAAPLLPALPGQNSLRRVESLLRDPTLCVRLEAVEVLLLTQTLPESITGRRAYENALVELQRTLQLDSDQSAAHADLARMHLMRGENHTTVIAEYAQAVALAPGIAGPRTEYAQYLLQLASTAETSAQAAELQQQATQLREEELAILALNAEQLPDSAEVQFRYAQMLIILGNYELAEEHLILARQIDSNWAEPSFYLAVLYENQERWEELLPLAAQCAQRWPEDPRFSTMLLRLEQRGLSVEGVAPGEAGE